MNSDAKYIICKKIDDPSRYFGLTLDEFIPLIMTLGIVGFIANLITGFFLAGLVWLLIRHFKKGQGTSWFLNMLYWYLPTHLFKGFLFIKTPASAIRHWLS